MNSKTFTIIGIVAILAFAGIAIASEDTSADAVPGTVTFQVVNSDSTTATYTYAYADTTNGIVLPTISDLKASIPDGKAFSGWYVEGAENTVYQAGSTVTYTAGTTYIAKLTDIKYTVIFDPANGTAVTKYTDLSYNADVTIPKNPSKTGYIFSAWTLDGVAVDTSKGLKATADVTYIATYTVDYVISFSVDGTIISTGNVSKISVPENPSKTGYTFAGWADGEKVLAKSEIASYVKMITADTIFTAVWTPLIYTVSYTDGSSVLLTETVRYNDTAVEPALTPTKDKYVFAYWSADGKGAYAFSTPVLGDLTLTAVFTPEPEPLAPAVVTYVVDSTTYTTAPKDVSKTGYELAGWSDGSSVIAVDALADYIAALAPGTTVTLTAVWTPLVYTVDFTADGEIVLSQSVKHGELVTEPKTVPVKDGYDFVKWDFDFSTPITSDTEIKAVFEVTPEPAKTGMDDPTTAIIVICVLFVIVAVLGIVVWQRNTIKSRLNARLLKATAPKENEKKP